MYESYWQLDARPFEHATDPRFVFAAESQRGALLKLRYVIENRRGAAVLAGESGLGKTLLVETLLGELDASRSPRVHLVFPQMPAEQLLNYLADQLTGDVGPACRAGPGAADPGFLAGQGPPRQGGPTIDASIRRIERTLRDHAAAGRHPIIVIDEAHLLRDTQALETIRLLLNFQHEGQPLATYLLAGQTGLVLAVRRLAALDERMAVTCLLARLSREETEQYIQHRLAAAGARRTIFDASAIGAVFELTHGIPRRINRLCDLALLVGYGEELRTIAAGHIESIYEELVGTAVAA